MALDITQEEADALIKMNKCRENDVRYSYPDIGGSLRIPLVSEDKKENFMLDISRGRIEVTKVKFQNRARQVIVLIRLDLGGAPHRNPDGVEIPCPHIHIYREGYADKWAAGLPAQAFGNPGDQRQTFDDFMRYCNVTVPPFIDGRLFL